MDQVILQNIYKKLDDIEVEHNVEILYAIESGSRAWGFESTDSDYDVRFIYKHAQEWYMDIFPQRDVIEYPVDAVYDYSGRDLKKALQLLNKSNPVLLEWLQSPIIYKKDDTFFRSFKKLSTEFFSVKSSMHHYYSMAKTNYSRHLKGEEVKIKKYFYVLRPILACIWIKKYNISPPIVFEELLPLIDTNEVLLQEIHALLEKKRNGVEMGLEPVIPVINRFIEEHLSDIQNYLSENTFSHIKNNKSLNEFFIENIML